MQCSPVSTLTKQQTVLSSDAKNEWFKHVEQFVIQLEELRQEETNRIDGVLMKFARDRLGIAKDISEIEMEKRLQLVFIVDHLSPVVDEMEAIAQWSRKNCDRHLMALVDRSFNERFAIPIWSDIQLLLGRKWSKESQINKNIEAVIYRFEKAMKSKFTSLSFRKRLQLSRDVKGKLVAADSDNNTFLDWITQETKKVEPSTAELFVSSKSDDRDEGEIISSLTADSKTFKKENVILQLHYHLSHLSASLKPNQIFEMLVLLNQSSDRFIIDDFNSYHWHCFRSTFLENWSHYFLSNWSHCYQETEDLRDGMAGNNTNEDDQSLNTFQLALERYLLFTTGLPPIEAVEKWRQLEQQPSDRDRFQLITKHLKKEIEEIKSTITPRINQLHSNELLKITRHEKYVGKDVIDLVDDLFEIISRTTVSFFDDAESVRSLLDVIESAQMVMDLTIDDAQHTSSQGITSIKIGEWKKKLAQWKVLEGEPASMVHVAVKELVETADSTSSNEDDCIRQIYSRISARRQDMLHTFHEALSWLETLVGYLSDPRSGIDPLTVVKSTVVSSQYLSWKALKNEKTSLPQIAMDILTKCTPIVKPTEFSWNSFFGAILNLKSNEGTIWLITKLANFVGGQLSNDRKRSTWCTAESWVERLDSLIDDTAVKDKKLFKELMEIQQVLIDYCSACYETKLLADLKKCSKNKLDMNLVSFSFKNTAEQLTNIVRSMITDSDDDNQFLNDQIVIRQLVLYGLIYFSKSGSLYWDEQTLSELFNIIIPEIELPSNKNYILSEMLNGNRKAFVQRWISMESSWEPERIRVMEEALRDKTSSLNDAQLFFSKIGDDIFTDEEKSYIDLIGDDSAVESSLLVDGQHPSCFLGALQTLAIKRIRTEFVRCFEPSITDRDIERYFPKSENNAQYSREILQDKQHIIQLCRSFNRLIRRKMEEGDPLRDWLLWIRDIVVPSLKSYEEHQGLSAHQIIKFFQDVDGFPLDLCRSVTTKCRPHQWIDLLAIFAIENLLDQLNEKCRKDEGHEKNSEVVQQLAQWWSSSRGPAFFLRLFHQKIRQEMASDPLPLIKLVHGVISQLTTLKFQSLMNDDIILGRFSSASLNDWPLVMRFAKLAVDWTPELALRLAAVLDVEFGQHKTDQFLRLFVRRFPKSKDGKLNNISYLRDMLQNLIRYPWIKDQWIAMIVESLNKNSTEVEDSIWRSLIFSGTIEREMKNSSQVDLSVEGILTIMSRDPESRKVIGNTSKMTERITRIRREYNHRKSSTFRIGEWTKKIKQQSSNATLQVEDFLAAACCVIHEKKNYVPRDVQLIAVIAFVSSDDDRHQAGRMPRRMGQISTGEGKTLISALVAIYHVLRHWNEDRHVNIITSSPVLAEANIAEIGWLFQAFGVSVSNNCDRICSNDENIRRERYNNDVIYGDLSSFLRDILLTKYFEDKDVTRNRNPGAIIVDEVDSMTLDKGENVLYMSHNIPEMYDLMGLFVQIWTLVNAPDVVRLAESSDIVGQVRRLIEPMIPTFVPNGLKTFSERHLSTWIRSAFRACYLLQPNDAYKVDDCGDGQGRRIVIMDKETGVEQVQSEWSDGLQQFLQLKHGMKWTPISLKAIFMSNIGYFSEFQGRMYGLTGTLGSTAECDLLRRVFGVDFFRLPRFRPRFCVQHEPIIAHNRQNWLDQMQQVVTSIVSSKNKNHQRSILVVCENIESAGSIYDHLMKTDGQIQVVKYVSSFDEDFKESQQQEILPGQVIIATNLAGRGTDLKPNQKIIDNGGLHVIIGFIPPNARVEAQAEGRTARCGQPGSFQFVIENVNDQNQSNSSRDPYGRMLELKSKRDDDERLRLDNIRRESLPKIKLEEKLFHEFYEKCVRPLKNKSHDSFNLFTVAINLEDLQQHLGTIKRNCLNNRWAMWLDANAGLIEKAHHDPVLAERLNENFGRLTMSVESSDVESVVSSPSEWMRLGRFYEENSQKNRADNYYDKVIEIEPKWCENALLDLARLALADKAGCEKKKKAKVHLKRARQLIDNRIEMLMSFNQQMDQCLNRQMERGSSLCHKRFEEQVTNQIRLWRLHSSKIDELLGVSLKSALAAVLPTEDDRHINRVIELFVNCDFVKPRRYSKKKTVDNSFDWPPFVVHCREPLQDLVRKKSCKLSHYEDAIGQAEQNLWQKLIAVYIDKGQEVGGGKIIKADQHVGQIPDTVIPKNYQRILPGWLKYHDGQDFSLVSSTLGIEDNNQLKNLEKWLEDKKLLQVAEKCFRHRILKPIPSMDQDPDIQLVKGVALSSCADVVAAWFSSPIYGRNGDRYILRPIFDDRKKKLAKQFSDYLVDVGVVKDPAIKFPSAISDRSRDKIKEDLDKIKNRISSLDGFDRLAELFYSEKEKREEAEENEKTKSILEQNIKELIPPMVMGFSFHAEGSFTHFVKNYNEYYKEAKALKERREKFSSALMQAVNIHLGQLKTLSQVKSSFCSLYVALPPPGDDLSSPTDEVQQFNNQHLDRVLRVDEFVSRWDWRIGVVALMGVAQLVGAMAFPFFSAGLVGEGLNDLMFAFQCLQSPGSFSWKSYLVDKAKSLAFTAVTMGLGALRLVKACGGSFKQAGKLMCRFNRNLKLWWEAGKRVLIQCAKIISSSVIGQAVSRFLTWLNQFIMEQVLERIKSFLFKNLTFLLPAFNQMKELMRSLMDVIIKSGKSAGEASQTIKQVLDQAKDKLTAGDWFTELQSNASSITSRMMRIFNDSSDGLSSLQSNYVGEYRSHASTGNTQGIAASANAGTIEKAIQMGKTVIDYGQKTAQVFETINKFTTTCETVTKLATHGSTYVGDLNVALQDELRKLKMNQPQDKQQSTTGGELSRAETERFNKFLDETEGEIQSSIMKTTLDTIQTAWLQPMIQLKIEKSVSKISSKLVQKYCPSILPEGFENLTDEKDSKNNADDDSVTPQEDQWIDEMGNGQPTGPIEMQNAVDASNFVLEIEDKTGQYTKGCEGNNFRYYPEGNPYSKKHVVKMSFTQNEDGTKHVRLIMPNGTIHDFVPNPLDPPDRCFYDALSIARKDPSVEHTINKLKDHAKGNDRARFMSKLGVNNSYQHLKVGSYRKIIDDKTTYEVDALGRTVRITTTETEQIQSVRNSGSSKVKEIKKHLGFQPGDVYSHDISLNSGGVDDPRNISRMTHECNRYLYREHEMKFEKFRDYNKNNGAQVITRLITKRYQHTVGEIRRMRSQGGDPDLYKTKGYEYDFCTGPRYNLTNLYKSGYIPNWNGHQARIFYSKNRDSRYMKRSDARRRAANAPSYVSGPEFKQLFRN